MGCLCYPCAASSAPVRCLPKRPSLSVLPALAGLIVPSHAPVTLHLLMQILAVGMCRWPGRSKQRNLYSWEIRARIHKRSMFLMKLSVACYIGDIERAEQVASAKYLSAYLFLPSTVLEIFSTFNGSLTRLFGINGPF